MTNREINDAYITIALLNDEQASLKKALRRLDPVTDDRGEVIRRIAEIEAERDRLRRLVA